jgi:hypothetical protein
MQQLCDGGVLVDRRHGVRMVQGGHGGPGLLTNEPEPDDIVL